MIPEAVMEHDPIEAKLTECTDILRDDPRHFLNRHYAKQYGQKSVKTTPSPAISGMNQSIFPESGPK